MAGRGQGPHRFGRLPRVRGVVPGFSGEPRFLGFVWAGEFLLQLCVVFVLGSVLSEMFSELEVIGGR